MFSCQKLAIFVSCVGVIQVVCHASDSSRQRRDDADKVIVTTIEEPPYVIMSSNQKDTGNKRFRGLIPDMMEYISDKLKMDYELKLVEDGKYGAKNSQEEWSGMIGEIINGESDMAAAPITISDARKEVLDFTEPFETFGTVLLMYDDKENPTNVNSLSDLADAKDIEYGIVGNGVTETFFKNSQDAQYQKMWQVIEQNKESSVEEGVRKVREGKGSYAFILESATAQYWADMKPCELKIVGDKINETSFGFALKKGNGRKDGLDNVIKEMEKNGELNVLRKKWKKGDCGLFIEDTSGAGSNKVNTAAGVTLACTALMLGVL